MGHPGVYEEVMKAANNAQFDAVRRALISRYIGKNIMLNPWDDTRYSFSLFSVTDAMNHTEVLSKSTFYRYLKPYRVKTYKAKMRLDRELCDIMAAVALKDFMDLGIRPGLMTPLTPNLESKIANLPNWTKSKRS